MMTLKLDQQDRQWQGTPAYRPTAKRFSPFIHHANLQVSRARLSFSCLPFLSPLDRQEAHFARLLIGPPEVCAEKLAAYKAAGVHRVIMWPTKDEIEQLKIFQEKVAPLIDS
jgi:alkanesulfonate monooxygenase SsuD/methylene tetrahydromethanopterin reductase-like flavin-dependent oxidoreductase (luciferase family)